MLPKMQTIKVGDYVSLHTNPLENGNDKNTNRIMEDQSKSSTGIELILHGANPSFVIFTELKMFDAEFNANFVYGIKL